MVLSLVIYPLVSASETFPAVTGKRLLARVSSDVSLETWLGREFHITALDRANNRIRSCLHRWWTSPVDCWKLVPWHFRDRNRCHRFSRTLCCRLANSETFTSSGLLGFEQWTPGAMIRQAGFLLKLYTTLAIVRLLARVTVIVLLEIHLRTETFPASFVRTFEWAALGSRVLRGLVDLQLSPLSLSCHKVTLITTIEYCLVVFGDVIVELDELRKTFFAAIEFASIRLLSRMENYMHIVLRLLLKSSTATIHLTNPVLEWPVMRFDMILQQCLVIIRIQTFESGAFELLGLNGDEGVWQIRI